MEEKTLHVRKTDNVKEKYCILIILILYQSKNVTFRIYITKIKQYSIPQEMNSYNMIREQNLSMSISFID